MKKFRIFLLFIVTSCSTSYAQYEQYRTLNKIYGITGLTSTSEKCSIRKGFRMEFSTNYLVEDGKDKFKLAVKETINYLNDAKPSLEIVNLNPGVPTVEKAEKDDILKAGYKLIEPTTKVDTTKFVNSVVLFNNIIYSHSHYLPEKISNLKIIRRQYISAIRANRKGIHLYFFLNYSPHTSYRSLVAQNPSSEYYDFVASAELTDTWNKSFAEEINAGAAFGFGSGNSFLVSYNQFHSYKSVVDSSTIGFRLNKGVFLGYRYQRIHIGHALEPVAEISYGIINGSKNDVYKLAAGVSVPLWSKNVYVNVVPYFQGQFKASSKYTGNSNIGARPYSIGTDVGLVYKCWKRK